MSGLTLKLFRDLKTLGPQVFTIAVLIVGGISVLISSWSSYQSLQRAKESYYEHYHFADVFADLIRAPHEVLSRIRSLPGVETVESRVVKEGLLNLPGQTEPALGRFVSWLGDHQQLNRLYLRQGELPKSGNRLEVVVDETFAKAQNLRVGDTLQVNLGGQMRVLIISGIGLSPEYVYSLSPVAPLPDKKHFGIFWILRSDLEKITGMTDAFNNLQMSISKFASVEEIKRQLDLILKPYGLVESYDRSKQMSNLFVEDEIRQQKVMALVVPTVFLGVAVFILNVILSRLISLHRPQIATLKSLGYSATQLALHYFQLVTIILLVGIVPSIWAGAGIGRWYAGLYADFFRFPSIDFSLSPTSIVFGFIAGLLPGWLGAAASLSRVFRLQPAEALRPPTPPRFQESFFDQLGLTNRMSLSTRMIVRSLLFRPLRTALGIAGISAAIAIVINGSFWTDVIDFMIVRNFYELRRDDLSVRLIHPKGPHVLSEFARTPGVQYIEGSTQRGARLLYGNREKDLRILGRVSGSLMDRSMEQSGKLVEPRSGAVLISRFFESNFGIRVGEVIRLKLLEGSQKEIDVTVQGFVDDIIGQQVYAPHTDLHRWLGEETTYDTLLLNIDPHFAEQIYVSLKEKPEVLVVSSRKLLLSSFTETVANMITTFTFVLYIFAVAIAGAVLYNQARISFSERSWELASLRILGFDVNFSYHILFLELGLQTLIALVPGLAAGYGLSYLTTHFIHNDTFKFPLVIEPSTYGGAVVVIMITLFTSGALLYRKVSKIDLSEALKARE